MSVSSSENKCILVVLDTGNTQLCNNLDWKEVFLVLNTAMWSWEKELLPHCSPQVIFFLLHLTSS